MEERKTIFDYLGQTLTGFGISVIAMSILGVIFGEDAREISSLFQMGNEGLAVQTLFQFLILSGLITGIRILFFTDIVIKSLSEVWRTIWMLAIIVLLITVFAFIFKWFPINMWEPWVMFFLCFGMSFGISVWVVHCKEKMENDMMAKALEKLKEGMENEREQ